MPAPRRSLLPLLPRTFTFFFCTATLWVLIGELLPALSDYRAARAALAQQVTGYEAVVTERDEKIKELESLIHDPQERERILDAKGHAFENPAVADER